VHRTCRAISFTNMVEGQRSIGSEVLKPHRMQSTQIPHACVRRACPTVMIARLALTLLTSCQRDQTLKVHREIAGVELLIGSTAERPAEG
jgi:hypothetical protein